MSMCKSEIRLGCGTFHCGFISGSGGEAECFLNGLNKRRQDSHAGRGMRAPSTDMVRSGMCRFSAWRFIDINDPKRTEVLQVRLHI